MSNSGKSRKVTVDLKSRHKLERGSVFHRLGNQSEERSKKSKDSSPEGKKKVKKHAHKTKIESDEKSKKIRPSSSKSDIRCAPKKVKEFEGGGRIKSEQKKEEKERHNKSQKQAEYHRSSEHFSKSHSKKRQNDEIVSGHKIENLIIEKQVSVSPSPMHRSRGNSLGSVKLRKKSKKHSGKCSSSQQIVDHNQIYHRQSPELHLKAERHKEHGRSRESKKKFEKETHRINKIRDHDNVEEDGSLAIRLSNTHPVLKKKSIKHSKSEKQIKSVLSPEKKSKLKHAKKERSRDRDVSFEQVSSLTYDSTDEYVTESEIPPKPTKKELKRRAEFESKDRSRKEEFVKSKKKKHENCSASPTHLKQVCHVKSRSNCDSDSKPQRNIQESKKSNSKSDLVKKKQSKAEEPTSVRGYRKEYSNSIQNHCHSDFSSPSKHSQVECFEYSQHSDHYERNNHSDSSSNTKEMRKAKTKRKRNKKVTGTASYKSPNEDQDSHVTKHTKKNIKRVKRKREERSVSHSESANEEPLQQYRDSNETNKCKIKRHAADRLSVDGIQIDRDHNSIVSPMRQRTFERQPSSVKRPLKLDCSREKMQQYAKKEYYAQKSRESRHQSKERLPKHQQLESRYSPERANSHYHSRHDSRNRSSERDFGRKSHDWQRQQKPHRATETKKEYSSRSVPSKSASSSLQQRTEHSKFIPQQKMLEPDYLYPPHPPPPPELFPVRVKESWVKGGKGRHSLQTMSSSLERERGRPLQRQQHLDKSQFHERKNYDGDRQDKFEMSKYSKAKKYPPKTSLRHESKDHEFSHVPDERRDEHRLDCRSVSRSSSLHAIHSDNMRLHIDDTTQNVSDHRMKHLDRCNKVAELNTNVYQRHSRIHVSRHNENVLDSSFDKKNREKIAITSQHIKGDGGPKLDDIYRGRKGQRSLSRKRAESLDKVSRRSGSSHSSHGRDRDLGHRNRARSPYRSSSSRREKVSLVRDLCKSKKNTEKEHAVQERDRKKNDEISDNELNILMKRENPAPSSSSDPSLEVDWNILPMQNDEKVAKEHDSILRNFSPYKLLMKTRVSMHLLPSHVVNQINELSVENKKTATHDTKDFAAISSIQGGLNSYTDERTRKRWLGNNTRFRHPFLPPRIINAKTYSASMKHYVCVTKIPLAAI